MKTLFLLTLFVFSTNIALADKTQTSVISCTNEAQEQTLIDLTAMVRNKSCFETGELTIEN
ncbi:MAG: hypothetical protein H7281_14465 [Bacteriovorax sp.]|nr:hypothetical protein [Bacteriovorax sp.]